MRTIRLAMANLFRQRLRSLVTAGSVAVAIGMLFTLLTFQRGYTGGLRSELDRLGAHLIVVPKGCPYDAASIALHGASWPCYLRGEYLEVVRQTRGVAVAAPVLMTAVFDPKAEAQNVYCGVTEDILGLKKHWRFAEGSFPKASGELLIGSELAKSRGWQVGQTVTLPGLDNTSGTVRGVLAPTQGAEDYFVYFPLADARRAFKKPDSLTHVLVRLTDPDQMDTVVTELRGCDAGMEMTVVPLAHLFETIQGLVRATRLLLGAIAAVALLAAAAGVASAVLMAVSERRREIGVLRAVGFSPADVFNLIWLETVALCVVGGLVGIVASVLLAPLTEAWLRSRLPFAPTDALLTPDFPLGAICLLCGAILGTLAALLPALGAARVPPAVAIREGL